MSLDSKVRGTVISPSHPDFSHVALNYNLSYHHIPNLILYPDHIEDIKVALKYATSKNLSIKCRSGGYSPVGFSNGNKALVLDFSNFKSFEFNRESETVTIGSGLLHGELNEMLSTFGYHFPGLPYQHVSIVGFISGGGIGLSSRTYGLGSDQLREVKVIDTKGNLIICNNQIHRDLFWAIRGGGGNRFGMIISLTLNVFPVKSISFVEIHYDKFARSYILAMLQNEYDGLSPLLSVQMIMSESGCCLKVLSYLPINSTKMHLQKFLSIRGKKSVYTQSKPYDHVMKLLDTIPITPHFFKLTSRFIYQKLDKTRINSLLHALDAGNKVILTFNLLGGKIAHNKSYHSSFNHREAIFLLQTYVVWEPFEYKSKYFKIVDNINKLFSNEATGMYINIAESNIEKVSHNYFPTHLHALSAIKLKYRIDGRILS